MDSLLEHFLFSTLNLLLIIVLSCFTGVRIFIFVLCVLFVLVIKFKMADDEASKSRANFGSPGGSKKFSFDGEHVVIQLDENGYLPPECSKYQYRYKTAVSFLDNRFFLQLSKLHKFNLKNLFYFRLLTNPL